MIKWACCNCLGDVLDLIQSWLWVVKLGLDLGNIFPDFVKQLAIISQRGYLVKRAI
jgi:hypothetical protein